MATLTLAMLAGLSLLMAYLVAVLIRWTAESRTPVQAATILFVLATMVEMLVGALVYFRAPSASTLAGGLWVAAGAMAVSAFPLFWLLASEARHRGLEDESHGPRPILHERTYLAGVVGLVLANELLMGLVFSAAAGWTLQGPSGPLNASLAESLLASAVNSPWFLLTMAAEMFASTIFLRDRLPRSVAVVFLLQSGIMAFSPLAFRDAGWFGPTTVLSSALMIGLFVYLLEHLYRHPRLLVGESRYLTKLLAIFALMMGGLVVFQYSGVGDLFAWAVVLEMVLFFSAIARPDRLAAGLDRPWLERPGWVVQLLGFVFLAELFMGAVLDLQLQPAAFAATFAALPLAGSPATILANALSNGFWFVAATTSSTWFLAMMGAEMGALVVLKLRETKSAENRIRLGAMVGCYAAFVVFYPSIYFSLVDPNAPSPSQVPLLGWSMGLGSYPVAPVVFGAILLTYAITGVLAALFGRRVVCSTFCSAALMYQGTALDAMKSFNRSSAVGRKYLSSRMSNLYTAATGVTMSSLVVLSGASYLDSIGRWHLSILGADPAVFLFTLSFSVLWYVMFVAIPYVGNYSCVTMGWCYTGAIMAAFQKVGVFKLKVHDREVCRACTTLDCAKGCPVGLVDMPGHFRTTGEFRSSKCCGVGNCVEACPYGNLYISDIRHWIRRRRRSDFSRAERRAGVGAVSGGAHGPTVSSAATGAGPVAGSLLPMWPPRGRGAALPVPDRSH